MSRQQKLNNDTNNNRNSSGIANNLQSAIQCNPITIRSLSDKNSPTNKSGGPTQVIHSDGNIIKSQDHHSSIKQKLVNKVRSWSSKDAGGLKNINTTSSIKPDPMTLDLGRLSLANDSSEDVLFTSDLHKAKDSLENLVGPRSNKAVSGDALNSRSFSHSASSQERCLSSVGLPSEQSPRSIITTEATSKVMTWDPWNKLGRKNKKENKKRKQLEKSPHSSRTHSPIIKNIEHTGGDDARTSNNQSVTSDISNIRESYEYHPYRHSKKAVAFVNDVLVVYFTGDEATTKSTEPLKKELDQQIRNKEMRRGHVPCTLLGNRQSCGEDYMAAWFKK